MANESTLPVDADVSRKLDAVLAKLDAIERRMDAFAAEPAWQLGQPIAIALAGLTDDMVKGLVGRLAGVAEVLLDPAMLEIIGRMRSPEAIAALQQFTEPSTLETLRGLGSTLNLVKSGMTDEMVAGLVRKLGGLAELLLDPFVLDALERLARALKAGQAEYPDVTVPPVGGIFGALRSANDPETRRVMAFALAVMHNLGDEFAGSEPS
ncbi:MAG TPA: DUF1641 domain-containing protein [Trueperaceae bacterium]|nr:DUF1641 domain-containing protein [Trueperaceae bacterium]